MNKKKLYFTILLYSTANLYAQPPDDIPLSKQLEQRINYTFNNKLLLETALSEYNTPERADLITTGKSLLHDTLEMILQLLYKPSTNHETSTMNNYKKTLCSTQPLYFLARYFELTQPLPMEQQSKGANSILALIGALEKDCQDTQPDAYQVLIYNFFMSMIPKQNALLKHGLILPNATLYKPTTYRPAPYTLLDFFNCIMICMDTLTNKNIKAYLSQIQNNNQHQGTLTWRNHKITLTNQDSDPSLTELIRALLLQRQKTLLAGAHLYFEQSDTILINPFCFIYSDMLQHIKPSQLSAAQESYFKLCENLHELYISLGETIIESSLPEESTPDEQKILSMIDAMDWHYAEKLSPGSFSIFDPLPHKPL